MGVADRDYMYEPRQPVVPALRRRRPRVRPPVWPLVLKLVRVGAWTVIAIGSASVLLLCGALGVLAMLPG